MRQRSLKSHKKNPVSFERLIFSIGYSCNHLNLNQVTDFMKIKIKWYTLMGFEFVQFTELHIFQKNYLICSLIM